MHRCKDEAEVGRRTQDALVHRSFSEGGGLKEEKTQEEGRKTQDARRKKEKKGQIKDKAGSEMGRLFFWKGGVGERGSGGKGEWEKGRKGERRLGNG